ncbi:DUF2207 domain-containing protein [Cutibacterium avidum]|uniref:DUF2207 domain-containing protein n=1 Tax=Cutibacterium avidum TaxID=33010 RepID=UPI00083E83F8|nr:DUF2207 domain-containing protein [Cutibacterium avidum]AOG28888.1 hypothetical protein BFS79_10675 [Cutibacterium avidum]
MGRTPLAVAAALLLSILLTVCPVSMAHAVEFPRITEYDVAAVLEADGDAQVTLDVTYYVPEGTDRGPTLSLSLQGSVPYDSDKIRDLDYGEVTVTSPTGADTTLAEDAPWDHRDMIIGSMDHQISGTQKYHLTVSVHGLVVRNPKTGEDVVNWPVFKTGYNRVDHVRATLTAPGAMTDATCPDRACHITGNGTTTVTWETTKIPDRDRFVVAANISIGIFSPAASASVAAISHEFDRSDKLINYGDWIFPVVIIMLIAGQIAILRSRRR